MLKAEYNYNKRPFSGDIMNSSFGQFSGSANDTFLRTKNTHLLDACKSGSSQTGKNNFLSSDRLTSVSKEDKEE